MSQPTPDPSRTVAVLTHVRRSRAVDGAARFIAGVSEHGLTCLLPPSDIIAMGDRLAGLPVEALHFSEPVATCELAVVFGGDGSILRGAEWALPRHVPLVGVNLGHVGFLAEAEFSEIDQVVQHVVSRTWTMEERSTVEVIVRDRPLRDGGREIWRSYAVNEVSMEKAARERMVELLVAIDGRPLHRWSCDGVLISTPTGSTAYAFSAGGPVIWPQVEALLLQPLSAHALFARPMVLGPTSVVTVQLIDTHENIGVIWCDGRRSVDLAPGMEFEVRTGPDRLRLARLTDAPFTDRLVQKFDLRVEGWRGAAEQRDARGWEDVAPQVAPDGPGAS